LIEVERMSHMSRSRTLLAVCFLLLPAAYTLAEDVTPEPPEATEPLDADRELLVDTLLRYEPEAVHDARDAVDDAMRDLDDAMEGGDPAQIEAREKDLRDAEEALETAQGGYEDAIRERVYGDPDDPETGRSGPSPRHTRKRRSSSRRRIASTRIRSSTTGRSTGPSSRSRSSWRRWPASE
jgi:hypothetical protein